MEFWYQILFFCTEMLLFFNLKFIFFIGYKWQTVQNVRLLINYPNYYWMITPKCSCCDLCLLIWFVFVSFFVSILSLSWYLRVNNYSLYVIYLYFCTFPNWYSFYHENREFVSCTLALLRLKTLKSVKQQKIDKKIFKLLVGRINDIFLRFLV